MTSMHHIKESCLWVDFKERVGRKLCFFVFSWKYSISYGNAFDCYFTANPILMAYYFIAYQEVLYG